MSANRAFAAYGFRVLSAGETSVAGEKFYAIQAIDGDAIIGVCTVQMGDAPDTSAVLKDTGIVYAPFTEVKVGAGSAGDLYCYLDTEV